MSDSLRVLVLAGGLSHERDVSLRSGRRVAEVLRDEGLDVQLADADAQLLDLVDTWRPDVVFPVLHGVAGEDGGVRAVLELVGVPYVGSAPAASRLAFDKPSARAVVARAGLDVPEAVALTHTTFRELGAQRVLGALVARVGVPLVVKPASGGSSLGMSVVRSVDALPAAMVHAYSYGDTALVERHVEGTEVAVSVVEGPDGEPLALPAVEIVPDGGVYDYQARYTAGTTEFFAPARLDAAAAEAAAQAALTAHRALGLRDVSRSDLIVDADGRPWFLEVNVAPGMTETSLLPQAVAAAQRSLGEVYAALVARAAARRA
ncbi:D-alanine--D-alanine ligase family protein [Vallicoccus soli]|uniref:D-alanine--D-alanine ligase n=1 Tax=Vallicoccus soli TaxID=2339232 RepID=A0A3A3YTY2_9ACTN|nr:D-alanine--D-alanine ligase [Vallicoccus soli]RJK94155.1 D-alanine--D-alanine ligase [Vallicoccus soli]